MHNVVFLVMKQHLYSTEVVAAFTTEARAFWYWRDITGSDPTCTVVKTVVSE